MALLPTPESPDSPGADGPLDRAHIEEQLLSEEPTGACAVCEPCGKVIVQLAVEVWRSVEKDPSVDRIACARSLGGHKPVAATGDPS
jgi:hypothetical protein